MQLAQEDINSAALEISDYFVRKYPYSEEDIDYEAIQDILEKHLDKFSIGYRNYN